MFFIQRLQAKKKNQNRTEPFFKFMAPVPKTDNNRILE